MLAVCLLVKWVGLEEWSELKWAGSIEHWQQKSCSDESPVPVNEQMTSPYLGCVHQLFLCNPVVAKQNQNFQARHVMIGRLGCN